MQEPAVFGMQTRVLERARRIERLSVAWNAAALPLSYARSTIEDATNAGRCDSAWGVNRSAWCCSASIVISCSASVTGAFGLALRITRQGADGMVRRACGKCGHVPEHRALSDNGKCACQALRRERPLSAF